MDPVTPRREAAVLSPDDQARFERDGYLVLEGFVPVAACDALRERARLLVDGFDPEAHRSFFTTDDQARRTDDYFLDSGDKIRFFFEERAFDEAGRLRQAKHESINKIGHAMHDLDEVFDGFSRTPEIERLVHDLGLEAPLLMQSMYIFKQPRIGGEVRCHQDSTFLHTEPESMVGLWFALEDANRENGCLWALPGGHREGLTARFVRAADRSTSLVSLGPCSWEGVSSPRLVPLEVKKGDLIVLHGLVPHMSHENRSASSRHAYTLHVIGGAAHYPETNWLQRAPDAPARGFHR